MLRMLSLTLALVATMTGTAHANSRLNTQTRGLENAMQLQIGGALGLGQPSVGAWAAGGGSHRYLAPQLLSGREQTNLPAVVRWLDLRGSKPGLAYPVTSSLSLGLRYTFLRDEDLVFQVAKTGALHDDYTSHRILVRAQWDF